MGLHLPLLCYRTFLSHHPGLYGGRSYRYGPDRHCTYKSNIQSFKLDFVHDRIRRLGLDVYLLREACFLGPVPDVDQTCVEATY